MGKYAPACCSCRNNAVPFTFSTLHHSLPMSKTLPQTPSRMEELLRNSPEVLRPKPGELLEGTVIFKGKNKLLLDLRGVATAIVSGRELRDSFNTFQDLHVNSSVTALVLEEENDEGLVIMSLRKASQQKAWGRFHDLISTGKTMPFTAQEANKGGLLANIDGIRTFLPVSQLAPAHYPRVSNADTGEILSRLHKLVGHTFAVKIITMDEDAGKIVVSEREAMAEERSNALEKLKVGDVREGIVSGMAKFGLFVTFDSLEGLVHISEIAWGHVKNPAEYAETGDRVTVKVIGIDGDKLSLSIKQLIKDPWEEVLERYPVGKKVTGSVVRFADYGAFVRLEKDINGLIHLSELAHHHVKDPAEVLTIGQRIEAQVINIDIDERRIGLSLKALLPIDKETLERLQKEREEEAKQKGQAPPADFAVVRDGEEEKDRKGTKRAKTPEPAPHRAEGAGAWVASKTGKKYYPSPSAATKKIKEENRVYFATKEEAEKAGYSA